MVGFRKGRHIVYVSGKGCQVRIQRGVNRLADIWPVNGEVSSRTVLRPVGTRPMCRVRLVTSSLKAANWKRAQFNGSLILTLLNYYFFLVLLRLLNQNKLFRLCGLCHSSHKNIVYYWEQARRLQWDRLKS